MKNWKTKNNNTSFLVYAWRVTKNKVHYTHCTTQPLEKLLNEKLLHIGSRLEKGRMKLLNTLNTLNWIYVSNNDNVLMITLYFWGNNIFLEKVSCVNLRSEFLVIEGHFKLGFTDVLKNESFNKKVQIPWSCSKMSFLSLVHH